jgi:hypothetical protein
MSVGTVKHVKHRIVYLAQLLTTAIVGLFLILPWAMTWVALNDHFIAPPIIERYTHCCTVGSGDPIATVTKIYSVVDPIVAGAFALVSSVILGALFRVHWLILWVVFCAFAYLGVRDFAHSRFGVTALFMLTNLSFLIFALASMAGFWCGSALRKRPARPAIAVGRP